MHPKTVVRLCRTAFPDFTLDGMKLKFVSSFRYLGHIVQNNECDDDDIAREIQNLFVRSLLIF